MGEVRVVGIRVEQPQNQPVLLLRESDGDRYLPIWIGQMEAQAIALEGSGASVCDMPVGRGVSPADSSVTGGGGTASLTACGVKTSGWEIGIGSGGE